MKEIKFDATEEEIEIMFEIAKRAYKLAISLNGSYSVLDCRMDLSGTHSSGMPLDFKKLLESNDANFGHDVFGIRLNLNRKTGEVENYFVPRCCLPEPTEV